MHSTSLSIRSICEQDFEYEYKCSICLEQLSERTQPDGCHHDFCLECIFAWTRYSDICPLCKVKITYLNKFDPLHPTVVTQTFKVEAREFEKPTGDYIVEFADNCYICQQVKQDPNEEEASLMVCDGCDYNLAHFQCEGKAFFPSEEWFCYACVAQAREQAKIEKLALKLRNKIRRERSRINAQSSPSSKSTQGEKQLKKLKTEFDEQLKNNELFAEESEEETGLTRKMRKLVNPVSDEDKISSRSLSKEYTKKREIPLNTAFDQQAKGKTQTGFGKRWLKCNSKATQQLTKQMKKQKQVEAKQLSIGISNYARDKMQRPTRELRKSSSIEMMNRPGIGRRGELAAAILKMQPASSDTAKTRNRLPTISNGKIISRPQQKPSTLNQSLDEQLLEFDFQKTRRERASNNTLVAEKSLLKSCMKR